MNDARALEQEALGAILDAASASSAATVRAIVLKAFSDPAVFHGFDRLRSVVQSTLSRSSATNDDSASLLATIDLFAYGTVLDYDENRHVRLSDAQLHKLRQLSVLSAVQTACARGTDTIPYSDIAECLGMDIGIGAAASDNDRSQKAIRVLEECIVSCVYAGLVNVRLCRKNQICRVGSQTLPCAVRDVPIDSLPAVVSELRNLQDRIRQSSVDLDASHSRIRSTKLAAQRQRAAYNREDKEETQNVPFGPDHVGRDGLAYVGPGSVGLRHTKRSRAGVSNVPMFGP